MLSSVLCLCTNLYVKSAHVKYYILNVFKLFLNTALATIFVLLKQT